MSDTNTSRVIETNSPEETLALGEQLGRAATRDDFDNKIWKISVGMSALKHIKDHTKEND